MARATIDALRAVDLFQQLPDTELEVLSRRVISRRYRRNELIFSQGDKGDGLYIVAAGGISITRSSADGGELILAMYEPGGWFGELALFDEEPRSAAASAASDCTTLFLSRSAFHEFLEAHPAALFLCLRAVVRQLRRLTDLTQEIALQDVKSRIARRLVHMARLNEAAGDSTRSRPLRITQQQLASMTGATRESVNKHLTSIAAEGIIRVGRGNIGILDLDRLEALGDS